MPILPVGDSEGQIQIQDVAMVLATMLYPTDAMKELREAFFCRWAVDAHAIQGAKVPADVLDMARQAEPHPFDQAGKRSRWDWGVWAGDQLFMLASLARHNRKHATRRKVVHVMEWIAHDQGRTGTHSTFNDAWRDYQSVAHLWCAFNLRNPFVFIDDDPMESIRSFDFFLAEAEKWRLWGQKFYPYERRDIGPILPLGKSWRMPPEWKPTHNPRVVAGRYVGRPTPFVEGALSGYRVEGRAAERPKRRRGRPPRSEM